jgi:hypothetical protein
MRTQHILLCVVVGLFCGGAFAVDVAPHPHEPVTHYTARVTCDADGKIANVHLRGGGLPEKGIDLKADVKAFGVKLKELAAKHDKSKPAALTIQIADQLLQAYVVELVDTALRSGFEDIAPVPIDKSKR